MELHSYPSGFAPSKPQQTIDEEDFERLLASGHGMLTKKYNGNRCHVLVYHDGSVHIFSRNGTVDWTPFVPMLVAEIAAAGHAPDTFLDGEFYVPSQEDVEAVQAIINTGDVEKSREAEKSLTPRIALFDILVHKGASCDSLSYKERFELLAGFASARVHRVAKVAAMSYPALLVWIKAQGIEGVVLADLRASAKVNHNGNTKRGESWKVKIRPTEDLIATGFLPSKDPSLGVGSLILHRRDEATGRLHPLGRVGSFEIQFDRREALDPKQYPMVVEVSHFGEDDRGNLEFPKIMRRRTDLPEKLAGLVLPSSDREL